MLSDITYFIAGNYSQFINFMRENNLDPAEHVYIDDAYRIVGLRNIKIGVIGFGYDGILFDASRRALNIHNNIEFVYLDNVILLKPEKDENERN